MPLIQQDEIAKAIPIKAAATELGIASITLYRHMRRHGIQTYRRLGERQGLIRREDFNRLRDLRPWRRRAGGK